MRLSDYADSITTPLVLNPAQSDRNGYASTSTRHNRDVGIMPGAGGSPSPPRTSYRLSKRVRSWKRR
jgi:hypothetical protein